MKKTIPSYILAQEALLRFVKFVSDTSVLVEIFDWKCLKSRLLGLIRGLKRDVKALVN